MVNFRYLIKTIFGPARDDSSSRGLSASSANWVPSPSVESSMKVSAVYSAVKLISEGVARLSLSLQRYNSATKCFVDYYDSGLYRALRVRPNEELTAYEFWRATVQQILLQGNAYILPAGDSRSLTLLSPGSTYYDPSTRYYMIADAYHGINRKLRSHQIIHLRNIGIDGGLTGLSPIQQAAQALNILQLADKNTASTLSSGGRMRGILTGSGSGAPFADALTSQLDQVSADLEESLRSGKTVVAVPTDMKFQTITLSPADAKVLESKQFTIRDIARYFRVHPGLLYEESNNTYKAAEVPNVMFLAQTLDPLLTQIENELLVKLVPEELWGRRRIRFDREKLYTTDLQTEAAYFEKMLQTGVYTVNELRAKKSRPPIEGGDTPLVSANLKSMDIIMQESNNQAINNEKE